VQELHLIDACGQWKSAIKQRKSREFVAPGLMVFVVVWMKDEELML
jgi:hypothetical protein